MNIHIFGHSIVTSAFAYGTNNTKFKTFTDLIYEKYNVDYKCLHWTTCCSESRILYQLKKLKDPIDVAIIFHGHVEFVFFPSLNRDFGPREGPIETWWEEYNYYPEIFYDRSAGPVVTASREELYPIYQDIFKYTFSYDSSKNNFYGALLQIDQYATAKKIPVIHCPMDNIPNWFSFSSGVVDYDITRMQNDDSPYSVSYSQSVNAINEEGNQIIFNKLSQYIDNLK